MILWTEDFEQRLRRLPIELQRDIAGILQAVLEDPEIVYSKSEYVWSRRDDVGPKSIQISSKNAVAPNATIVVAFDNGKVAGVFVKDGWSLLPEDIAIARENYEQLQNRIGSSATIWNRRIR